MEGISIDQLKTDRAAAAEGKLSCDDVKKYTEEIFNGLCMGAYKLYDSFDPDFSTLKVDEQILKFVDKVHFLLEIVEKKIKAEDKEHSRFSDYLSNYGILQCYECVLIYIIEKNCEDKIDEHKIDLCQTRFKKFMKAYSWTFANDPDKDSAIYYSWTDFFIAEKKYLKLSKEGGELDLKMPQMPQMPTFKRFDRCYYVNDSSSSEEDEVFDKASATMDSFVWKLKNDSSLCVLNIGEVANFCNFCIRFVEAEEKLNGNYDSMDGVNFVVYVHKLSYFLACIADTYEYKDILKHYLKVSLTQIPSELLSYDTWVVSFKKAVTDFKKIIEVKRTNDEIDCALKKVQDECRSGFKKLEEKKEKDLLKLKQNFERRRTERCFLDIRMDRADEHKVKTALGYEIDPGLLLVPSIDEAEEFRKMVILGKGSAQPSGHTDSVKKYTEEMFKELCKVAWELYDSFEEDFSVLNIDEQILKFIDKVQRLMNIVKMKIAARDNGHIRFSGYLCDYGILQCYACVLVYVIRGNCKDKIGKYELGLCQNRFRNFILEYGGIADTGEDFKMYCQLSSFKKEEWDKLDFKNFPIPTFKRFDRRGYVKDDSSSDKKEVFDKASATLGSFKVALQDDHSLCVPNVEYMTKIFGTCDKFVQSEKELHGNYENMEWEDFLIYVNNLSYTLKCITNVCEYDVILKHYFEVLLDHIPMELLNDEVWVLSFKKAVTDLQKVIEEKQISDKIAVAFNKVQGECRGKLKQEEYVDSGTFNIDNKGNCAGQSPGQTGFVPVSVSSEEGVGAMSLNYGISASCDSDTSAGVGKENVYVRPK